MNSAKTKIKDISNIELYLRRIAYQIYENNEDKELIIVGIEKNGKLLANKIFKILKNKGKTELKKNNFINFIKDRPGHDLRYALNSNLFYKKTNFKIKNNFDLNLKKTINWYLENDKWVKFAKNKHINRRIGLSD